MHITDLQSLQGLQEEAPNARMAESVDALVSNTSGAIRAGSIPAPGTEAESQYYLRLRYHLKRALYPSGGRLLG